MLNSLIQDLTEILLSKVLKYATKNNFEIGNLLVLEKKITVGLQLIDNEKLEGLSSYLVSGNSLLVTLGLNKYNKQQIHLLQSLALFGQKLDAFFISKLFEEFLIDCGYQENDLVVDISDLEPDRFDFKHDAKSFTTVAYSDYYYGQRFGSENQHRLGLSKQDTDLLDKVVIGDTVFTEIQQCCDETAKLLLRVIHRIEVLYNEKEDSFFQQMRRLEKSANKNYAYYEWYSPTRKVLNIILKYCENTVRDHYRHKRKLSVDYVETELYTMLQNFPIDAFKPILETEKKLIGAATRETLVALNSINRTRWKVDFQSIKSKIHEWPANKMIGEFTDLYDLNRSNPSLSKIYYETTKVLVDICKITALRAYLNYFYLTEQDPKTKVKPLLKSQNKKLFTSQQQVAHFNEIIGFLSVSKDIKQALLKVPDIYKVQKKEIKLDYDTIEEINNNHSQTAEELGALLIEEEDQVVLEQPKMTLSEGVPSSEFVGLDSVFDSDLEIGLEYDFSPVQLEFIQLLIENKSFLYFESAKYFMKEYGLLKSQLINGINEAFYQVQEENLLEETEHGYRVIEEFIDEAKRLIHVE